jgi:hypothetical protein
MTFHAQAEGLGKAFDDHLESHVAGIKLAGAKTVLWNDGSGQAAGTQRLERGFVPPTARGG